MGEWTSLETPTGRIRAWRADPHTPPRGALVVVQEIFGAATDMGRHRKTGRGV